MVIRERNRSDNNRESQTRCCLAAFEKPDVHVEYRCSFDPLSQSRPGRSCQELPKDDCRLDLELDPRVQSNGESCKYQARSLANQWRPITVRKETLWEETYEDVMSSWIVRTFQIITENDLRSRVI